MKGKSRQAIKLMVSCLLTVHLIGIFVAPASVPPASPLAQGTWKILSPYLQATNLNHGYHFFAPEPGSSSLIEFVGTKGDGQLLHGVIPDKQTMRPRLLYHRYFMLTEYLGGLSASDPQRQPLIQNYARQLMNDHGLREISLTLVTHRPSARHEILIGAELDDADTYQRNSLGSFQWNELNSDSSPK
jgi:hypothetical protein